MNKTIEQATKEYTDVVKPYLSEEEIELVQNAFEAGAEYALANQWHDIREVDMPEERFVLVRSREGGLNLGMRYKDGRLGFRTYDNFLNISHWCEIPQFENKQSKR